MPAFGHCRTEITLQHQKTRTQKGGHSKSISIRNSFRPEQGLGMKSEEANSKIISWGDKEFQLESSELLRRLKLSVKSQTAAIYMVEETSMLR